MTHDHEAFSELAASYVLGSLSTSEREAFEVHLATCDTCATDVRAFGLTAGTLAYAVPQVEPSPALRDRVLNSLAGSPRSNTAVEAPSVRRRASHVREAESTSGSARMSLAWLAAAAALVVAAAVGTYAVQLRGRVSDLESELARAILRADASDLRVAQILRNVADAQSSVAVLTAPDLARVDLAGQ